jgi:hypothetical protein
MNYLAHGRKYVDRPWVLAGTALPDWLRVVDKRARVRPDHLPMLGVPVEDELRQGIRAHHDDDAWFHKDAEFDSLTHDVVHALRALSPDPRFRASTIGHVLVEMLVDAALLERDPALGERYYAALESVDGALLASCARAWSGRPLERLPALLDGFRRARFILDYVDDDGVCGALQGVLFRVGLPPLPDGVAAVVAAARPRVGAWARRAL